LETIAGFQVLVGGRGGREMVLMFLPENDRAADEYDGVETVHYRSWNLYKTAEEMRTGA
jgi:hypothetical protein